MKERTYSEKEIASMLERAAELQAEASRDRESDSGLTLAELAGIAKEAGLDPHFLQQAAREFDTPGQVFVKKGLSASNTHIYVDRVIEGEMNDEAWEDIVAELSHRFDTTDGTAYGMPGYGVGSSEQTGRSVQWKHLSYAGVETRVLLRPRGDHVTLRISQKVGFSTPTIESMVWGTLVAGAIAGTTLAIADAPLIAGFVFLIALAAFSPLIRFFDKKWRNQKHKKLDGLASDIVSILTNAQASESNSENLIYDDDASIASGSRIDKDLLDAEHRDTSRATQRKKTRSL